MLKWYNLLFYLLSTILSLLAGMLTAGLTNAGKGQMMAGGAIVVFYGLVGSVIGLVLSLVLAKRFEKRIIIYCDIVLFLSVLAIVLFGYLKYQEKLKTQKQEYQKSGLIKEKSNYPFGNFTTDITIATPVSYSPESASKTNMGLGMFSPAIKEDGPLYLYGNIDQEKSVSEHLPADSISFIKTRYGNFEINAAPPYLVPEHLKLDYDLLYFKVVSVTDEFLEVIVNKNSEQSMFIDKNAGKIYYWPEFLLIVNSVEFLDPINQQLFVKPLLHAGKVNVNYSLLKPLRIESEWMFVSLLNDDLESVGKAWIIWNDKKRLLIQYNLLS